MNLYFIRVNRELNYILFLNHSKLSVNSNQNPFLNINLAKILYDIYNDQPVNVSTRSFKILINLGLITKDAPMLMSDDYHLTSLGQQYVESNTRRFKFRHICLDVLICLLSACLFKIILIDISPMHLAMPSEATHFLSEVMHFLDVLDLIFIILFSIALVVSGIFYISLNPLSKNVYIDYMIKNHKFNSVFRNPLRTHDLIIAMTNDGFPNRKIKEIEQIQQHKGRLNSHARQYW